MIRGSLEMVGIIVKADFISDVLQGGTETAISVKFLKMMTVQESKKEDK